MTQLDNTSNEDMKAPNNNTTAKDSSSTSLSLSEKYHSAIASIETSPLQSAQELEQLQQQVAQLSLFSSNESVQDVSTKSLPLLALEHYLAVAYTRLPTGPGKMKERKSHLLKSMDLWTAFLQKLESLQDNDNSNNNDHHILVTPAEQKEYHTLLECSHHNNNTGDTDDTSTTPTPIPLSLLPPPRREDKIARFKAKQQAQQEIVRLKSLAQRRQRMGIAAEEVLDELDQDTLNRNLAMTNLLLAKADALEEWASTIRELPMMERMLQMQEQQQLQQPSSSSWMQRGNNGRNDPRQRTPPPPSSSSSSSGLQVTHITLDGNRQLQFRKEEIKSQVFRPGWNQPTMSLAEFADRERAEAIAREERQSQAEQQQQQQLTAPRRYDQLIRDGMEDNDDLVDASAALDRQWDEWKEENPRGSGNKHAERGDKNF